MSFIGWTYDIAREQSPRETALLEMATRSRAAGYSAIGLYLEHRFAYASAPWAASPGCLTPGVTRRVAAAGRAAGLRIIPFLNTLGHMEGFIRTEGGQALAEGASKGALSLQICATRPECAAFARGLVADALDAFDDDWVHLGGDETRQLGQCPSCAERVAQVGKAGLYADFYAPLCQWVLERGRRPCLWGDMLIEHRDVLARLPRETLIFDWQYFQRPHESTRMFRERGFDVICCPSVQSYNSGWCFLNATQQNIDEHAADARELGALGVCVTTWEFSHFTNYLSTLPLIYAAGRRLARGEDWRAGIEAEGGSEYARAAEILGNQILAAAPFIQPGTWRTLRDRFIMQQNPFLLWQDWRQEACGPAGDEILRLCKDATACLPSGGPLLFPIELHRVAVEWVRQVERVVRRYRARELLAAAAELEAGFALLERLRPGLREAADAGGAAGDLNRLDRMLEKIDRTQRRLAELERTSPRAANGAFWLPAFETLAHDGFIAGDQAAWRTGV